MPNAPIIQATEIRLYRFPNVDISHQNVTVFQATGTSTAEQVRDALFGGLDKMSVYDFSFLKNNKVRVPYAKTQIQNYNYLSYKDPAVDGTQTAAGLHRIYCFIVDMEFVNPSTTEITFEVDYWYTYSPFLSYPMGFVERCHPNNDNWGSNVEGEPIDVGMVRATGSEQNDPYSTTTPNLCVLTTWEIFDTGVHPPMPAIPQFSLNSISNLKIWRTNIISEDGRRQIRNFFAQFGRTDSAPFSEGVVACYLAPSGIATGVSLATGGEVIISVPNSIGGYSPRWKKVLQYPYCYAEASAGANVQQYQFECSQHANNDIVFRHCGTDYGTPTITAVPTYYKGEVYRLAEAISISDFPQVAWNSSSFAQWLNENGTKQSLSGLMSCFAGAGGGVTLATGLATGGAGLVVGGLGAIAAGAAGIAGQREDYRIAASKPPVPHGTPDSNALYANGQYKIKYNSIAVLPEHARKMDMFFDRFGYAQNQTMSVGLLFNHNWNNSSYNGSYIKTKNYSVRSSGWFVPARALEYISTLFNRGITIFPNSTIFPS